MDRSAASNDGTRLRRLNSLLQEEVSAAIQRECELPRGVLVSVVRVEVSPDVAHARVFVSVLPEEATEEVEASLEEVIFDVQQVLNKRLHLKKVPKIRFAIDASETHAERIRQLLEEETHTTHNTPGPRDVV